MQLQYEEEEKPRKFMDVARLPKTGDNVAVAIDVIPVGTLVELLDENVVRISHTVLEGHRFAVKLIPKDHHLYSWGMQFGTALKDIYPGEYLMNERGLKALKIVDPNFDWPSEPNFDDRIVSYVLDEEHFKPAPPMELVPGYEKETFLGYLRDGKRGVGTRNYVVVFSASSLCNGIVQTVTEKCQHEYQRNKQDNMDGVVCCVHTEGSMEMDPLNKDKILRTLAGFLIHPNVGAAIVVYNPEDVISRSGIEETIQQLGYSSSTLPITWVSLPSTIDSCDDLINQVQLSIQLATKSTRSPQPISTLCLALQCGGSDAFSGVTANPLQGQIAEYVIHRGGSAILAETDELIGADSYILDKVSSVETAREFQRTQRGYEKTANFHGVSAQANPSGGNFYRGLYNIAIKSLGAAMKKTENTRLEGVLPYGRRIGEMHPGYYFMDTPGNDIESVTGQVAGGCNIIMFSTGNGSITNFPFVPISLRYNRLSRDLDINAGKYLDGMSLEDLTKETFQYVLKVAQGMRTFGEKANHSQIQIWRNWYCGSFDEAKRMENNRKPSNLPYPAKKGEFHRLEYTALKVAGNDGSVKLVPQSGLVVFPTSLCSGQVAKIINNRVTSLSSETPSADSPAIPDLPSKFSFHTALVHTEGCAEGYGASQLDGMRNYDRVAIGHLLHPMTRSAFMVEHGCEKSLLSYFELHLRNDYGENMEKFGQGSVQREGGIENTVKHAEEWIVKDAQEMKKFEEISGTPIKGLIFALMTDRTKISDSAAAVLARIVQQLVQNECVVVIPENDLILKVPVFVERMFQNPAMLESTILNADRVDGNLPGVHVMRMNSPKDYLETVTSLAATGASMILAFSDCMLQLPGHPFVPVLRVGSRIANANVFDAATEEGEEKILAKMMRVLSREEKTKTLEKGLTDFQILRTMSGFSL